MNFKEYMEMRREMGLLSEEETGKQEEESLRLDTINGINEYLRRRGLLNDEEDKKTEISPKEIQVRFIKKVETDKIENKEIEENEEEE